MDKGRVQAIVQGEIHVSDAPDLAITTTVGSCVAACLWDPVTGLGGMNHFLLPENPSGAEAQGAGAERYGVYLMELLINGLLGRGADRGRLQAKAFGGARITRLLTNAGPQNADFVESFLRYEGIPLVGGSLRGEQGRRVQFWPASGRARQMFCGAIEIEPPKRAPARVLAHSNDVELF